MHTSKSVLLLHDQLQDARIWLELEPLASAYARVITVSPPPMHTLGPPAAWSDHMARYVRETIAGLADLAVTIGGVGEAGIDLVSIGDASAAVLIDPDVTPVATNATSARLLREPGLAERFLEFLEPLEGHVGEFSTTGTLSEEGIGALVDVAFGGEVELPEHHRELLRSMMTDQLRATLPLDMEAERRGMPERPDWISRLAGHVDRCTVALSPGERLGEMLEFETKLRELVPGVGIAHLTSSRSHLLGHPPEEINQLIRDILTQV